MAIEQDLKPLDENWERVLAVVAHPDDLEYGAASAVARWTAQGKQVSYLMVSRGEAGIDRMSPEETGPLREEEEKASARLVGVETVEFLDYQDGVIEYGLPLRRDIARAIRRHRPNMLVTLNFQLTFGGLNLIWPITAGWAWRCWTLPGMLPIAGYSRNCSRKDFNPGAESRRSAFSGHPRLTMPLMSPIIWTKASPL